MGGIGNNDLGAPAATRLMPGSDHQHAGQFPLRSGRWLQTDGGKAGNLRQRSFQPIHQLQCPLIQRFRGLRVDVAKARQPCRYLVDFGVVLHGAAAQRIKSAIDPVVPGRQARVVADDINFRQFGEVSNFITQQFGSRCYLRHIGSGQAVTDPPRL